MVYPHLKPLALSLSFTFKKRHFPPRAAARTHALHAGLDHAPGRPLSARIQRDARAGRQFSRAVQEPRSRDRGHAAAARALSARRGDPVLRHPDRSPMRWAWGLYFAEGEGPRFERPLREEWEIRESYLAGPRRRICATCSTPWRRSAARWTARAAHRILGQSVYARVLHDRRPRQHGFRAT